LTVLKLVIFPFTIREDAVSGAICVVPVSVELKVRLAMVVGAPVATIIPPLEGNVPICTAEVLTGTVSVFQLTAKSQRPSAEVAFPASVQIIVCAEAYSDASKIKADPKRVTVSDFIFIFS
jgi:hypothetical protein